VVDRAGARDRQHRFGSGQQPGQGDLVDCRLVAPCDVSEGGESVEVLDRRPRQKGHLLLLAQVDQRVRPAIARVIAVLNRHNRGHLLRSTQLILVDVGQPDVADLALFLQRDQSADRVF
jgi:hypothetical protein